MTARSKTASLILRTVGFTAALIVCVAMGIGVWMLISVADGSENQGEANGGGGPRVVPVEVAAVERRDLRETIRGIGTLRASRVVHLSPEIDGTLAAVHFTEGDVVEAGTLLFALDDRKLQQRLNSQRSALRAARARLDIARTTFDRVTRLREQNVASSDEYDRARTDLEAAESDVEQFEANVALVEEELRDTRFHAPFDGVVSERLIDPGNYVQVGQRVATLYQADPLEMSFRLSERHLGRVRMDQTVQIMVASLPEERFGGVVTFISPQVNEQTRDFLVKASVNNEDLRLRPGSFGTAVVNVGERPGRLVIPERAVVPTRSGHIVFLIDEQRIARMQPVTVGLRTNSMVEITEGLTGDETVVVIGQLRLNEGSRVEIAGE